MKKRYITPTCKAIIICTPQLLTTSENEYWSDNNGDQGLIHFKKGKVEADDAD